MNITIDLNEYGQYLTKDIFEKLSQSKETNTRYALANCNYVPLEVLVKLAENVEEQDAVVCSALSNPIIPLEVLERFSNNVSWIVRTGVARNINCSSELNEKLANDKDKWVRAAIARKNNTSLQLLTKLANDPFEVVRINVAENRNVSLDILNNLLNDSSWEVRKTAEIKLKNIVRT